MEKKKEPPKIRVVIRKRPLNGKESQRNDRDILTVVGDNSLKVQELKEKVDLTKYIEEHQFTFDNVFEHDKDNREIYDECVLPLVSETFKGAKTTCFAFGQTGSGKTFTMMGTQDGSVSGMYTLAAYDILDLLEAYEGLELYISFYEIYCGALYDLLNKRKKVECREDAKQRVNIIDLTEKQMQTIEEIMDTIHSGLKSRTSGQTGANDESSRSHAILSFTIKHGGKNFSKMSFIDLAGSERGADVIDTGKKTKQDGAEINKSLLALKECIRALDKAGKKNHLPFRGSKLTQVLKDSFMGNSKTIMIANVSPALSCCEPTLNTLRYADRVKELKKDPALRVPGAAGDELSKELMLARQTGNTKIIKIDQKTGRPIDEMAELSADFKPTLKKDVNPEEILARKRAAQQASQQSAQKPQQVPQPKTQGYNSPHRQPANTGIGGGSRQNINPYNKQGQQSNLKQPARANSRIGQGRPRSIAPLDQQQYQQPQQNNFMHQNMNAATQQFQQDDFGQHLLNQQRQPQVNSAREGVPPDAFNQKRINTAQPTPQNQRNNLEKIFNNQDMEKNFGDENFGGENLLQDDGADGFAFDDNVLAPADTEDCCLVENVDDGFNGVQVEDMEEQPDLGEEEQDALDAGKNSYLEMSKSQSTQPSSQITLGNMNMAKKQYSEEPQQVNPRFVGSRIGGGTSGIGTGSSGIGGGIGRGLKKPSQSYGQAPGGLNTDNQQKYEREEPQPQDQNSQVKSFKERLMAGKANDAAKALRSKEQALTSKAGQNKVGAKKPGPGGFFGSVIDQKHSNQLTRPQGSANHQSRSQNKIPDKDTQNMPQQQQQRATANTHQRQFGLKHPGAAGRQKEKQENKPAKLGDGVPTADELKKRFKQNQEQLGQEHEKLIEQILEDEEQLIFQHNTSCKKSIKIVEEEMQLLKEVDKPGSDVESYVVKLDKILLQKIDMMTTLRKQLLDFYKNIKTEEALASLFHEMQDQYDDDDLQPGQ